jgi:hypothetical protein
MAQREAKFDWPRDQFLRDRVHWPFRWEGIWPKGNVKTVPPFVRRGGQKVGHPQDQRQNQDKSTTG